MPTPSIQNNIVDEDSFEEYQDSKLLEISLQHAIEDFENDRIQTKL